MKFIRYILSHLILIGFVFLLVLAYHYRSQLFSADIVGQIDHIAGKVMFWRTQPQVSSIGTGEAVQTPVQEPAVVAQDPALAQEQTGSVSDVTPGQTTPMSETATPPGSQSTDQPSQPDAPGVAESMQAAVAPSTETQDMAPLAEQQAASSDQTQIAMSGPEMLDQARIRFNEGDVNGAIALYQQLTAMDTANPNVFGELGNIFYSQGKWKEAGEAYYEAANRLLDLGNTAQVQYLYRVIQGLDQESADKLKQRLGIN